MQRSDFRHFIDLPVLWGDMDSLKHVNNVQFFRYLESARIAYFTDLLSGDSAAADHLVLADIQCSFRRQLSYPSNIEVGTRVSHFGNSSLHIESAIFEHGTAQVAAQSNGVLVWFDFISQRAISIPQKIRAAISAFEPLAPTS